MNWSIILSIFDSHLRFSRFHVFLLGIDDLGRTDTDTDTDTDGSLDSIEYPSLTETEFFARARRRMEDEV